jgi:hypothetical protein
VKTEREVKLVVTRVDNGSVHLSVKTDGKSLPMVRAGVEWASDNPEPTFEGWALGDEVTLILRNETRLETSLAKSILEQARDAWENGQ